MAGFGHSITRNKISHKDEVIDSDIYVSLRVSALLQRVENTEHTIRSWTK